MGWRVGSAAADWGMGGVFGVKIKKAAFAGSLEILLNENLLLQVCHFTGKGCVTHFNFVEINT